jgi:hypothetical protein
MWLAQHCSQDQKPAQNSVENGLTTGWFVLLDILFSKNRRHIVDLEILLCNGCLSQLINFVDAAHKVAVMASPVRYGASLGGSLCNTSKT